MKIRTLIKKLQKLEEKYGNLPVNTINSEYDPDSEEEDNNILSPIFGVGEEFDEDNQVVAIMILDLETTQAFSA
jgi:hypothetical protein